MNDRKWIAAGVTLFLAVALLPFWYNRGQAVPPPAVELSAQAAAAGACVLPAAEMRSRHMELLNLWREAVVRESDRIYTNHRGKRYVMSLSNACLACHPNRAEFCDRCHDYNSVEPDCWNCHLSRDGVVEPVGPALQLSGGGQPASGEIAGKTPALRGGRARPCARQACRETCPPTSTASSPMREPKEEL